MNSFTFLCRTKTCFGLNALENMPFDLAAMGCRKPMIIQDRSARLSGAAKTIARAFRDSAMTLGISPPIPEPDDNQDNDLHVQFVKTAHAAFSDQGHDSLIALGGAQTAQTAKALNMAITLGPQSLTKDTVHNRLSPLVFIPQSAAAGLASTGRMQFNNRTFQSDSLAPDQVIMAPELLIPEEDDSLIDTALFCLAKGAEVLTLSANPLASAYAQIVVSLADQVLKGILTADPGKVPGTGTLKKQALTRQKALVQAAVMAGYLDRLPSPLTAMGKILKKKAGISPGQAMCLVLPALLETAAVGDGTGALNTALEGSTSPDFDSLWLTLAGSRSFGEAPAVQRPYAAIQAIRQMLNRLYGFSLGKRPRSLAEAGWEESSLALASKELSENSTFAGMDRPWIETLFTFALTGRPVAGI